MARPLAIGRALRLGFGVILGLVFPWNLLNYTERAGSDFPASGYWIGVAIAWWYFSELVVGGFGRSWGRRPQVSVFLAALALVVIDLVAYGEVWDLPLAWAVFVYTEFVIGTFAISFLLSGIFGVPGCEVRGMPHVLGMIRGRPAQEHP